MLGFNKKLLFHCYFYKMNLLSKLRINVEDPVWIINAPGPDCLDLFRQCLIKNKLSGQSPVGQLVLFVIDGKDLAHQLPLLKKYIAPHTLFWICYPKKTGTIVSDLIYMKPWDIVFNSGYRGQTSVSINNDWTGMRFTNAPKKAPSICDVPMEQRKIEGIDFVARTVQLPADVLKLMKKHKGMEASFNAMSFTNKKEFIQSLAEAKKPETRLRRIEKMIEALTPIS